MDKRPASHAAVGTLEMVAFTRRYVEACPVAVCFRIDGGNGDVGTPEGFHIYRLGRRRSETVEHFALIQELVDVNLAHVVHFAVVENGEKHGCKVTGTVDIKRVLWIAPLRYAGNESARVPIPRSAMRAGSPLAWSMCRWVINTLLI